MSWKPSPPSSRATSSRVDRLVGAVMAEQHDEWAEGRRYLGLDVLTRTQAVDTHADEQEVTEPAIQALTA